MGWFGAFWVLLWIFDAHKDYLSTRLIGHPVGLIEGFINSSPWWGAWVVLSPVVALLAYLFPLTDKRWVRHLPVHIVAGMLVPTAQLLLAAVVYRLWSGDLSVATVYPHFAGFFHSFMMFGMIAYFGFVGVYAAWTHYRGLRAQQQAAIALAIRGAELERSMTEARLTALRQQLNPHFLFNALNAVAGLARRGETERVTAVLARLGDLLRTTLADNGAREIRLDDELAFVEDYVEIERERFHDRLTFDIDAPPNARAAMVPPMILQPLVENAVRHGIGRGEGRGRITVRARRVGDSLELTVADTGPGFSDGAVPDGHGVGLANTQARLEQLYNGGSQLRLENAPEGGALVTVSLPYHVGNGDHVSRTTHGEHIWSAP